MIATKLPTRQSVIDNWKEEPFNLKWFVCPHCREVLHRLEDGILHCPNQMCLNETEYTIDNDGNIIKESVL